MGGRRREGGNNRRRVERADQEGLHL